jgi:hypothetical protein
VNMHEKTLNPVYSICKIYGFSHPCTAATVHGGKTKCVETHVFVASAMSESAFEDRCLDGTARGKKLAQP